MENGELKMENGGGAGEEEVGWWVGGIAFLLVTKGVEGGNDWGVIALEY